MKTETVTRLDHRDVAPKVMDTDTLTDVYNALCVLESQMQTRESVENSGVKQGHYAFLANAVMGQIKHNRKY